MPSARVSTLSVAFAASLLLPVAADAGCGWSWIDHQVTPDTTGVWNSDIYRNLMLGLTVAQVGGALWEGAESRFGKTMWQGIDSQLITLGAVEVMKYSFRRERPSTSNNPCAWFVAGNYSFPSGEAANAAALVTPYILEYGREYPWTYGLVLLPLYVGAARVKNQAHWQSDVLVGWTAGGLAGWYAHSRETPLLVEILPHGVVVGLKTRF